MKNENLNSKIFIIVFLFSSFLLASPMSITFQSRIIKPDGKALEASSVDFRFNITDTVGSCVIYQEDFANRNMAGSKGLINLALGSGSKVFPATPFTLLEAFNNYNSPTLNCQSGGNIVAGIADRRKLIVQFNDGSGWQTVPAMDINSTPYAFESQNSHKLGDYPAIDYLRTATLPSCAGSQALHFNGTSFTCVAIGGGAGTVTSVSSANADIGVSMASPTPVLTLNSGTGINQIVKLDGSAALPAVSGTNLTNLNATSLASGTVAAARMPALTGDVTMTAGTTTTAISNLARSKLASGTNNHVLINDGSGVLSSEANLSVSRGGTGAGSFTANQIVAVNGSGTALTSFTCGLNQIIKFDVTGNATCGTDAGGGGFADGGNTFAATATIGTNSNHNLEIETNGTTKMTILANGNVGIGTASPTSTLHVTSAIAGIGTSLVNTDTSSADTFGVYGEARSTGYNSAGVMGVCNSANCQGVYGKSTNGAGVWADSQNGNGIVATSSIQGSNGAAVFAYGNAYGGSGGYALKAQDRHSGCEILAGANGTSLSTNCQSHFGGNVGIGTSFPSDKLHVVGGGILLDNSQWLNFGTASDTGISGDAVGDSLNFYTGGSSRMMIGNTGNVGIGGVNSPNFTLDISPMMSGSVSMRLASKNGGSSPTLISMGNMGAEVLFFGVEDNSGSTFTGSTPGAGILGTNTAIPLQLSTQSNVRMTILDNGNVGIGVTNPSSLLQVAGDITPNMSASKNLGSGARRWNNIYLSNAPDVSSDARLKKNVQDSDLGLEFINSLRPVSWIWKDQNLGNERHYGVIAQETALAIKNAKQPGSENVIVRYDRENDSYSVRYTELISPIIQAIKEIHNSILKINSDNEIQKDSLAMKAEKSEVESIKMENEKLKKDLYELTARLEKLEAGLKSK